MESELLVRMGHLEAAARGQQQAAVTYNNGLPPV